LYCIVLYMEELISKLPERNVFIQIGTNDGDDNFRNHVKHFNPKKVILVEPNEILINQIKSNYAFFENELIILNLAINTHNKDTKLYISNNWIGHSDKHFSLVPMNDWADSLDTLICIDAKSITFENLCKEYNITHIDFLQIDTEGFDSEIINSINLDNISIDLIRFEDWPFSPEVFSKFNENKLNLGTIGINNTIDKLRIYNYNQFRISDTDGNDIIAIKNNINIL